MKTKDTKKKQLRKLNGVWLLILYCFIDFGIPRLKKMNYSGSVKWPLPCLRQCPAGGLTFHCYIIIYDVIRFTQCNSLVNQSRDTLCLWVEQLQTKS